MPFEVTPSDQVIIGGETTEDDFLQVNLEDGSKIYVRNSTGRYQHLTIDRDFVPAAVATLARQAARSWLRHRRGYGQDDQLQAAFGARESKSQRLLEFIAYALLGTIYVQGSPSAERRPGWQVQDSSFNVGQYPRLIFGSELEFPNIKETLRTDNSQATFELILPSPIVGIRPVQRWDVEVRWALR